MKIIYKGIILLVLLGASSVYADLVIDSHCKGEHTQPVKECLLCDEMTQDLLD